MGHKDMISCVDTDRGVGWQLNATYKILKPDNWIMISLLRSLDFYFIFCLFTDVCMLHIMMKPILAIYKLIIEFILLLS